MFVKRVVLQTAASITPFGDVKQTVDCLLAGASAVAVGTANFVNPMSAVEVIDGIDEYLQAMGIGDVNEIIGTVNAGQKV